MNVSEVLSRTFEMHPTIKNYVSVRRRYPDKVIDIAVEDGFEWVFQNSELLEKFEISPHLVYAAIDAECAAIAELSLSLMERIIERDAAQKAGKTHAVSRGDVISDALINNLINLMLSGLSRNNHLHMNRDLMVRIRHQISGGISPHQEIGRSQKAGQTLSTRLLSLRPKG